MIPYIHTNDALTAVIAGRPHSVSISDALYKEFCDALFSGATEAELTALIERTASRVKNVGQLTSRLSYNSGVILLDGQVLHNYATTRLISLLEQENVPVTPLINFVEKLDANPSKAVVDNLYEFLEAGNIPLTDDGDFLVYKAVRSDYMDIYTGNFDNRVGRTVTMQRNRVDENRERTCSHGLHVCSFAYLPHYAQGGGRVMLCKVNPADVVAIPADYRNTKMRVSKYEVVGEVSDYYKDDRDILGDSGGHMNRAFFVEWSTDGNFSDDGDGGFYTKSDAVRAATDKFDELKQDWDDVQVVVTDHVGTQILVLEE